MKIKKYIGIMISLIIMGVISYLLTVMVLGDKAMLDFSDSFIAITSLVISLVALVITLITYIAIDSVNEITSMEGNVLENENYTISSARLIDDFKEAKDEKAFSNMLMARLDAETKKNNSCMELADSIQAIIDHLIWHAYTSKENQEVVQRSEEIIKRLDKNYDKFSKVSNAVKYTLHENLELIKYVLKYQRTAKQKDTYESCALVNIKGKMIRNPISKIVYYDYLGLDYRRSAASSIGALITDNKKEFSIEGMKAIQKNAKNENYKESVEKAKFLLEEAKNAFQKAVEYADGDILWNGYVLYNLARVSVMCYLLEVGEYTKERALKDVERAVYARQKVLQVYNVGDGYICERLNGELEAAQELLRNVREL